MAEDLQEQAAGFGHLHNDFLNAAVSAGVIGILSYIALLLAPLVAVLSDAAGTASSPGGSTWRWPCRSGI